MGIQVETMEIPLWPECAKTEHSIHDIVQHNE